jgi:hypothetical protein
VAAEVAGSRDEAHFWRALPPTLATLRSSLPQSFTQPPASLVLYTDPETGISAYRRASEDRSRCVLEYLFIPTVTELLSHPFEVLVLLPRCCLGERG